MKPGFQLIAALFAGAATFTQAFTLDIASTEVTEFGRGPRSILVPGYGEVTFESGLDGALVVDSGYASTDLIKIPASAGETGALRNEEDATIHDANPSLVKMVNRGNSISALLPQSSSLEPLSESSRNPPDGLIAVPEAASAALGLLGMLMLLLRRRPMSPDRR
jgi:MYXO-CTERM domain-containing protein